MVFSLEAPQLAQDSWNVLRCQTGKESALQSILLSHGVVAWLGVALKEKSKKKIVEELLFPSYIFIQGLERCEIKLVDLPYSYGFLRFSGIRSVVTADEMASVRRMIASREAVHPWAELVVGQRVRVTRGSMEGLEGVLAKIKGADHFIVNLPLMGRSVGVVLDGDWLEAVKK